MSQAVPVLQQLTAFLRQRRAWIFFDCQGAVLWQNGEPVGRFVAEAADNFQLELDVENIYGCDDDQNVGHSMKEALAAASEAHDKPPSGEEAPNG